MVTNVQTPSRGAVQTLVGQTVVQIRLTERTREALERHKMRHVRVSYGVLRLLAARVPDNSDACLSASENAVLNDLLMSVGNVHLSCDRTHERSLHPENTHLRDGRLCTRLSLLTLVVSSRSFCATVRPTNTLILAGPLANEGMASILEPAIRDVPAPGFTPSRARSLIMRTVCDNSHTDSSP